MFLFIVAVALAAFFAGMYVQYSKIYPFSPINSAYKTLVVHLDLLTLWNPAGVADQRMSAAECVPMADRFLREMRRDFSLPRLNCQALDVTRGAAATTRVKFVAGDELAAPVLQQGELGTFLDYCPGSYGCLAVEYSVSGAIRRTWPFRPEDIEEANIVSESDYPYEHHLGWSLSNNVAYFDLSPYPNGDLLVVFGLLRSFPYGGGIARLAPDGRPRWYRKDYSHHWPYVVDEELILVPSMRLERASLLYTIGPGETKRLTCKKFKSVIAEDYVNVINGRSELLEEIPVLEALVQSRYAGVLSDARSRCDPTHLNFVHLLGKDAGGAPGIAPGDLVVSLRSISAFGILDRDTHQLKRLVRGSFRYQHGVRHLEKARFLMFDNQGTDGTHGPSRLLMVDLATGKETSIFPNDRTSEQVGTWYMSMRGQFDVSPDGRRVLLVDYPRGRGFDIRLSDGEILNTFLQIHDLSTLPGFPDALAKNAWIFELDSLHYANRWER